ncbi:MAG: hypothetical protein R2681_15090 [Pyrinomonadaceae bacterium]
MKHTTLTVPTSLMAAVVMSLRVDTKETVLRIAFLLQEPDMFSFITRMPLMTIRSINDPVEMLLRYPETLERGRVITYGAQGSAASTNDGTFFQDKWQPTNRLTLNLGIRKQKEEVPSFNEFPAIEFGWGDKIAPRIGGAFDITGDGKTKYRHSLAGFTIDSSMNCRAVLSAVTFITVIGLNSLIRIKISEHTIRVQSLLAVHNK